MLLQNQISIAVIIPTYNRAHTLSRAIESVVRQTLQPQDIIIVDDGSTDNTEQLCKKYPQLQYIKQANRGVSAARNSGIQCAQTEWIALLDSDDEWLPMKLQKQLDALQKCSDLILCHTDEIWIRRGVRVNAMRKHQKRGGDIFKHCLPLCAISPSSAMIRRGVFDEIGFFNENLPACEDYDFWLRFCARYPVLYIDEPLIKKYGGHHDQLSQQYWGMDRFRVQALQNIIDTGALDESDKTAALDMLITKCTVLRKGAVKHRNHDIIAMCDDLLERYVDLISL